MEAQVGFAPTAFVICNHVLWATQALRPLGKTTLY